MKVEAGSPAVAPLDFCNLPPVATVFFTFYRRHRHKKPCDREPAAELYLVTIFDLPVSILEKVTVFF